jgi:hypothetical protein
MPISYSIDAQLGVIVETWVGNVSARELAEYWRKYLADPEVLSLRRTLVDLRQSHPTFTGRELSDLISSIVDPILQGRDWKTAIIVDKPVQFGISRQYHVFAEHYSRDAIFSDPAAALEWLTSQP